MNASKPTAAGGVPWGSLEKTLAGERVVARAFFGEDGQRRYLESVHTPRTDAAGTVVGVLVCTYEVIGREQAEAMLRESEAMRAAAEQVASVGSSRWELSTQRVSWSPEMYRLFDVDPGEFHGDFAPVLDSRVQPGMQGEAAEMIDAGLRKGLAV